MEAFGGLKVFQKQYEQLLEYEEVMRVTGVSEFEEWDSAKFHKWLNETAPIKKSGIRVLEDDEPIK